MPVEVQTIQQAYRYAFNATPRQQRSFASHAGAARFAYNWGLATVAEALDAYAEQKAAGVEKPDIRVPRHFDLCKLWTAHKDNPNNDLHWVEENFSGTYQAALRDAATAWKNFFDSRRGKRAGRRVGRPRFRSKHRSRKAFQVHGGTLQVPDAHHIKLPKIGLVKTHESTRKLLRRIRKGTARLVRGTVAQDSRGRWHIALTVELQREIRTGPSARQRTGGTVGIDLGVRDTVTISDGTIWQSPRPLETAQRKLARAGQQLARKTKGSAKRERARRTLSRIHGRIANIRRNATDQITTELIHRYATIGVEGWDAQRLAERGSTDVPKKVRKRRNRQLADAAVGMIRWQLEHKASWYGANVVVTGNLDATGRTCSACGQVRAKPIPPAHDTFTCLSCGWTGDRRINTTRVVAKIAAEPPAGAPSGGDPLNARGDDRRPTTPRRGGRPSVKREARTNQHPGKTGTPDP